MKPVWPQSKRGGGLFVTPLISCLLIMAVSPLSGYSDQSPQTTLEEAMQLRKQGKYEEALQKYIWFHDHALEFEPALYGVRLSFALDEWIELGKKYPKALEALKTVRDKKTAQLLSGKADYQLFHDVESINDHLGEPQATVALFKSIDTQRPEFATSTYTLAEVALVKGKEYQLAKKHMGDPAARLSVAKKNFERGMQYAKTRNSDVSKKATESIFTEKVVRMLTILDKSGDQAAAHKLQADALKILDEPEIRKALASP